MVYYGLSLASGDLSGNMYRDFALTSLVELPATILAVPSLEKYVSYPFNPSSRVPKF